MRHYISARTLERICVLDLVESVLDALAGTVEKLPDDERRRKVAVLATRILMSKTKLRELTDKLELAGWEDKSLRRYSRALERLKGQIRTAWPGATVDAVKFLAAIMEQVSYIEEGLPRGFTHLDSRAEWSSLHVLVQELYFMFDKAGDCFEEIESGVVLGQSMRRAVRGESA